MLNQENVSSRQQHKCPAWKREGNTCLEFEKCFNIRFDVVLFVRIENYGNVIGILPFG